MFYDDDKVPVLVKKAAIATRLMFLVCGLAYSGWAPMVPYVKARLDLNEADLGMILLAFGVGALLSMPLTGWFVYRYGSRRVTAIAAPCMVVLLPLLAVAPTGAVLALELFIFGAMGGALNVAMNSQALAVERAVGRSIMSGFHCLFSAGGLFGAGVMSLLLEAGLQLYSSAMILSLTMAVIIILNCRHLLPSSHDVRTESQQGFMMPSGKVVLLGIVCFVMFLAEGAMLDWGAVFLRAHHGYEPSLAGIGYAVFSVAMALGRLTGDKLIQRLGPTLMIRAGGTIAAVGLLMAVTLQVFHAELLGFFLIGVGAANIVPIMFSAAGRQSDTSPSTALTMTTTLGYTGMLLGPAIIGFVAQATTLSFALASVALLLLLVGLCGGLVSQTATPLKVAS